MREERSKSAAVFLVAAVFLSGFFAQTTDAFRLTKTAKRDGQKEVGDATTAAVQEGKVLFGADFEKRSDLDSLVRRASDAEDVQADFAGWPKGFSPDARAKEAAWQRLSPSLQCAGDQMKFRVIGQAASQLALAQGNSLPLPLTNIPSNCGFNMQRNSIGLVMVVPFDGCNVVQQGGTFALPLRFQGVPVLLLCPRQILPQFQSAPFLSIPSALDVPQVLSQPLPQVPQIPLTPPVFPAKTFLAQEALDPGFPSSVSSFSQFPTLANPLLHVFAQNPNFHLAPNTLATQLFASQATAPLPQAHFPASLANAPLPQAYFPASQANAPLPQAYFPASQANAPLPQAYFPASQANAPLPQAYFPASQANAPLPQGHFPASQANAPLPQAYFPASQANAPLPQGHFPASQAKAPLPQGNFPASQAYAPLPRANLPLGFQPDVGHFQPVPDPGVKHLPQFPPHTHFLPMYPRGFPQTHHLPGESDPWLAHYWPGEIPSQSDPNPGMMPSQERTPLPSDPKPGVPWTSMMPLPSDPWQGNLPPQSDPWPGMSHSQIDPKPEIIPLPETEPVDSIPSRVQSHYLPHSHPFRPASLLNRPHTQSHHQFDVFPPPNTKS